MMMIIIIFISTNLFAMSDDGTGSSIRIRAALISKKDGQAIADYLLKWESSYLLHEEDQEERADTAEDPVSERLDDVVASLGHHLLEYSYFS